MSNEADVDGTPASWNLLRETGATIAILVSLHCVFFTFNAPLCKTWSEFSGITAAVAFIAWVLMVDMYWVYSLIWTIVDQGIIAQAKQRQYRVIVHYINFAVVFLLLSLTAGLAGVLGNVFPVATMFLLVTGLISFAILLAFDLLEIRSMSGQVQMELQRARAEPMNVVSRFTLDYGRHQNVRKRW